MGTIFEELIRRFNEENNEEAGEHFTPRDVVKLMADDIAGPQPWQRGLYPPLRPGSAAGNLRHRQGRPVAIAKADLLLKGEGATVENLKYGSTLSGDTFPLLKFDFMLSNPPYGKSWKTDLERLGGKGDLDDPRFVTRHGGDLEYQMITRSSDGQLMFLVNKLTKMKHGTRLGSRIAEVHNGSSLFTGDAGSG